MEPGSTAARAEAGEKGSRMNAKLTQDQAAEIKWLCALQAVLTAANIAKQYGVSTQQVQRINRGIKWASTEPKPPKELSKSISPSAGSQKPIVIPPVAWMNSWMQLTAGSDART
jgi:hypothetical protein